ncbi:MAG TPA: MBL fold metallo-hydrolase [Candidatus Limnocylindria bacterium]|jgi:glyoxylase-like metal-dependent hydrolase (beta-lactamase superfamily II)|nr:MBL fold metallo-hydrolase [Candidatus Limnocylindria bacterium]
MTDPLHDITPAAEAMVFGGGVSVRIVRAGWFRPDAGSFFGVVPRPLWERFAQTDDRGRILCRLNLLIVEAGGKRILVETGTGLRMTARDREIKGVEGGDPVAALEAVGEDPASFDFVVVSHLHYDHAGGMVDVDGRPAFVNARYVVQRDEAQAAHGDELRLAGIMERDQLDAVQGAGQLAEVHGTVELVDGVTVTRTGGHTRGSQAVLFGRDDGGARGVFFGDLIPTRWQLPIRWTSAYDDYPIEAVEIRREIVSHAAEEGWWCYFTHDPGAQPIQIEATEKGVTVRAE